MSEHIISNNDKDKYWTWPGMRLSSDSSEPDIIVFFKTHIIPFNDACVIWETREEHENCIYNTPSDKIIPNYYKLFKQGNVKNPVISIINSDHKSVAQILKQNHDHFNKYDYVDNLYYIIAFTMYDVIKDFLVPETVQVLQSPLNNNLYVCRYVGEDGKPIYLRNASNINEFENVEDIYKQVYNLLFNKIYKQKADT